MTPIADKNLPPSAAKAQLRRELRARRRALNERQQARASRAILRRVLRSALFSRSKRIGAYIASDGEVCLRALMKAAWRARKQVYLPCITGPGTMEFRRYCLGDRLRANQFGILEPSGKRESLPCGELDLILAPLVGFDHLGNRLGMGGGFYDRALLNSQPRLLRPQLVGVAHGCQQVTQVPAQRWDKQLNWILTEDILAKMPGLSLVCG